MNIEKSINISDNLRVWMLAGEMKQAELAEYLGMVPGMMSQRLMGVKEWRDEDVERISKLMNVSEEKLVQPSALGEALRRFERSRKNPSYRKNFGGRLNRLAGKKGKTIRELSAELGMDYSGVCKWVMGTGLPSAFALVKIANYFGMTAAQLAGFEPEAEKAEPEKAEPEKAEPEKAEPEKAEPEKAEPENEAGGYRLPEVRYSSDEESRSKAKELVEMIKKNGLRDIDYQEAIDITALFIVNIRDIPEYEPVRDAAAVSLAALIRAAPQKVIVDEGGDARCPVCGLVVEHGAKRCMRCCQLLDWEIIEVGDEVYMSGDWSVRFWVGGKEENGFVWGYDMSFRRCCEHPADLVRSGRNCPELARGLEAAARAEMQEGENEKV